MKVLWCVCSGPDKSHLVDVSWHSRLKDAKQCASRLPPTPFRKERPHKIEKHIFEGGWK